MPVPELALLRGRESSQGLHWHSQQTPRWQSGAKPGALCPAQLSRMARPCALVKQGRLAAGRSSRHSCGSARSGSISCASGTARWASQQGLLFSSQPPFTPPVSGQPSVPSLFTPQPVLMAPPQANAGPRSSLYARAGGRPPYCQYTSGVAPAAGSGPGECAPVTQPVTPLCPSGQRAQCLPFGSTLSQCPACAGVLATFSLPL